nr:retrotransposon protein, putative, Ty1-copia subclass [Tanacetum cinerariifolium]
EDTSPSKNTSKIPAEVEGFEPPQEEKAYVRRHESYKIDYEETFSPVADIRAIKILIAISAFNDYEIWKMDVKTTFLNGYLDEDIYMVQPEGFIDPKHLRKSYLGKCFAMKDFREAAFFFRIKIYRDRSKRLIGLSQSAYMDKILKIFKIDNSKRGNIPMQERLDLNKSQGASTPEKGVVIEVRDGLNRREGTVGIQGAEVRDGLNRREGTVRIQGAGTFGASVPLTALGDLDMLTKDIKAGKHEELLSGMTNDKSTVVMDALVAMCDSILAENTNADVIPFWKPSFSLLNSRSGNIKSSSGTPIVRLSGRTSFALISIKHREKLLLPHDSMHIEE